MENKQELNWTDVVMMSPWDVRFAAVAMNTVFWYVILFYPEYGSKQNTHLHIPEDSILHEPI
jgi:hypothetical protein